MQTQDQKQLTPAILQSLELHATSLREAATTLETLTRTVNHDKMDFCEALPSDFVASANFLMVHIEKKSESLSGLVDGLDENQVSIS